MRRFHPMRAMMGALGRLAADDGTGVRVLDLRLSTVRPFHTLTLLHELDPVIDQLEDEARSGQAVALVLRLGSAPEPGADLDLEEIRALPDRSARVVWAQEGQRVLRRLERLPIPTVAILEGRNFTGTMQIALACGARVAIESEATRIGFPEAGLGVLPAWGGTVRLPRLIGVRNSLELLLSAHPISARRGRSYALLDRLCSETDVDRVALELAAMTTTAPGTGARRRRRALATRLLEETAPGRRLLYTRARRRHAELRELPDVAADRIVRAVSGSIGSSREKSFSVEAEVFAEALSAAATRGSLHAHLLVEPEARAVREAVAAGSSAQDGGSAAVLGGSLRGALYADLLVSSGYSVTLKDVSGPAGRRSAELVRARLAWASREGQIAAPDVDHRMERLVAATGFGGFGRLELVVEAAVEDPGVKREVLAEVEDHVVGDCLLVATSAIVPLEAVAPALKDASRLVGLHVLPISGELAPAEVVGGTATSEETIHRACDLARRLGRVPVRVRDVPGLVLPRLAIVYVAAAEELIGAGATSVQVDRAMQAFGMPIGPLELGELLGRGALEKAASALAAKFDDRFLVARRLEPDAKQRWTDARIQLRILSSLVNEAALILDEGVVASARDLDLAVLLGLGFPKERGGLLYWADATGTRRLCEVLGRARPASPLMVASPLLARLGAVDGRFYNIAAGRPSLDTRAPTQ